MKLLLKYLSIVVVSFLLTPHLYAQDPKDASKVEASFSTWTEGSPINTVNDLFEFMRIHNSKNESKPYYQFSDDINRWEHIYIHGNYPQKFTVLFKSFGIPIKTLGKLFHKKIKFELTPEGIFQLYYADNEIQTKGQNKTFTIERIGNKEFKLANLEAEDIRSIFDQHQTPIIYLENRLRIANNPEQFDPTENLIKYNRTCLPEEKITSVVELGEHWQKAGMMDEKGRFYEPTTTEWESVEGAYKQQLEAAIAVAKVVEPLPQEEIKEEPKIEEPNVEEPVIVVQEEKLRKPGEYNFKEIVEILRKHNQEHPDDKIYSEEHYQDASKIKANNLPPSHRLTKYVGRMFNWDSAIIEALDKDPVDLMVHKLVLGVKREDYSGTARKAYLAEMNLADPKFNQVKGLAWDGIQHQLVGVDLRNTGDLAVREFVNAARFIHHLFYADHDTKERWIVALRRLSEKLFKGKIKDRKKLSAAIIHGSSEGVRLFDATGIVSGTERNPPPQSISDDHSLVTWLKNKIDRLRGKEPTASKYHSEILISLADEWNRQMYQILTHEFLQGEVSKRQVKAVENGIFNSFLHALFFAFNGIYINDANKELLIQERLIVTPKNFDRFLGVFLNNLVLPDFNAIDPELATQWKQSVDQIVQFKVDQVVNPIASDLLETRGEVGKKTLLMTPDGLITALSLEEFQNRIVQWDLLMAKYRLSSHEFRAMLEQQLRAIFPEVSGDFLSYQFIKPLFSFINPSGRVKLTDTLEGGYEQIPEAPNYKEAEVKITEFLSRSGIVVLSQESEIDPYEISKLRKVMMWNRYHMEGGGSRKIFHMNDSYEQFEPLNSYSLFRIKADDNGRPVIVRDEGVELFNRMVPNMDASALALSRTNRDYLFLDERRIIPQDQVVMLNPAELIEYVEAVERDVAKSNGYWDFPDIMKFDVKTVDLLIYKIHSEQWNKDKFNTESEYKERAKHATSILMRYLDEADLMWKYIQEGKQSTYGVLSSREALMWFLYHPEKIKEMETAKLLVYGLGSWEKNKFWNANRTHPELFDKFIWEYRNHDRVYDAYHYAAENGIDVDKYEGTGILGKGLFGYAYSDEFSAVRYQRLDQLGLIDHEKERTYDWLEWRSEPWWKRLINRSRASTPEMFVQQPQIFNVVEVIQMIDRELAESSYSPEDIRKFLKEIKRNPDKNESWNELTESVSYEQLLKDDPAKAEKFIQYSIYIDNHEEIGTLSKFKLVAALRHWIQIEFAEEIARYEATKPADKKSFVAIFKGACDRLIFGSISPVKEATIVYFKHLIKGKKSAPVDKILEVIKTNDDFRIFVLAHNEVHPDRLIVNDLSYFTQRQTWNYPSQLQLAAKIKGFRLGSVFPIPANLALERQSKGSFDNSQSDVEEKPTTKIGGKSDYLSMGGLAPLLAGNNDKPGLLNSLVKWVGNEVVEIFGSNQTKIRKQNGDLVTTTRDSFGKPKKIQVVNASGNKVLDIDYEYSAERTVEIIRDKSGHIVSKIIYTSHGDIVSKMTYQYYAGKLMRKTAFNSRNIVVAETDYTYDSDDKVRSKIVYNADGKILSRLEFEYDMQRRVISRTQYDASGKVTDRQTFIPNAEYITFNDYLTRSRRGSEKGTRPFIARFQLDGPYDFIHDGGIDSEFADGPVKLPPKPESSRPAKPGDWSLNDYYLQIDKWHQRYPHLIIESLSDYLAHREVAGLPKKRSFDAACERERILPDSFFVAVRMMKLQSENLQTMFKNEPLNFEMTLKWVDGELLNLRLLKEAKFLFSNLESQYEWMRRACAYEILNNKSMPRSYEVAKTVDYRVQKDVTDAYKSGTENDLANKIEAEVLKKPYSKQEIQEFVRDIEKDRNVDRVFVLQAVLDKMFPYGKNNHDVRYELFLQIGLFIDRNKDSGAWNKINMADAFEHWIEREFPHLRDDLKFKEVFAKSISPELHVFGDLKPMLEAPRKATLIEEALEQYKPLIKGNAKSWVILKNINNKADLVRFILAYNQLNPKEPVYSGNEWLQLVKYKNFPNYIVLSNKLGVLILKDIFKQVRQIEAADIAAKTNSGNGNVAVVKNGFGLFGLDRLWNRAVDVVADQIIYLSAIKQHTSNMVWIAEQWNKQMLIIIKHDHLKDEASKAIVRDAESKLLGEGLFYLIEGIGVNEELKNQFAKERMIVTPHNLNRFVRALTTELHPNYRPNLKKCDPKKLSDWEASIQEIIVEKPKDGSGYLSSLGLAPLLAGNSDKPGLLNSLVGWIGREVSVLMDLPNSDRTVYEKSNGDVVTVYKNRSGKPELIKVVNLTGTKVLEIIYTYHPDSLTTEIIRDRTGNVVSRAVFNKDGSLASKIIYQYYANKLGRKTAYNGQDIVVAETDYTYDLDGKIKSKIVYNAAGTVLSRVEFEYDSARRVVLRNVYDAKGKISSTVKFKPVYENPGSQLIQKTNGGTVTVGDYTRALLSTKQALEPEYYTHDRQRIIVQHGFDFGATFLYRNFVEPVVSVLLKSNPEPKSLVQSNITVEDQIKTLFAHLSSIDLIRQTNGNSGTLREQRIRTIQKIIQLTNQLPESKQAEYGLELKKNSNFMEIRLARAGQYFENKRQSKNEKFGTNFPTALIDRVGIEYLFAEQKLAETIPFGANPINDLGRLIPYYSNTGKLPKHYTPHSSQLFELQTVLIPIEELNANFSSESNLETVKENVMVEIDGKKFIRFFIHPTESNTYVELSKKYTLKDSKSYLATPTSSARSLVVYEKGKPDKPFIIKLTLSLPTGGAARIVNDEKATRSVAVNDLLEKIQRDSDNRWDFMRETASFVPKNGDFGGYIVRDIPTTHKDNIVIPLFSIISNRKNQARWIEELFIASGRKSRLEFVEEEIVKPLLRLNVELSMDNGITTELHQQNVSIVIDRSTKKIKHIIIRDMDGHYVDHSLRVHSLNKSALDKKGFVTDAHYLRYADAGETHFIKYADMLRDRSIVNVFKFFLSTNELDRLTNNSDKYIVDSFNQRFPSYAVGTIHELQNAMAKLAASVQTESEKKVYKNTKSSIQSSFGGTLEYLARQIHRASVPYSLKKDNIVVRYARGTMSVFLSGLTNSNDPSAIDKPSASKEKSNDIVRQGFDFGLGNPNSSVRKALRNGWNTIKVAVAGPQLVPVHANSRTNMSASTAALNIVEGSSQAASGNEAVVPKAEVARAKPNLTTPESIYHYKFTQQQGWDFPTNRVATAPEMAAYLDIAIQEKHPEFYSKWLAKLGTLTSKYEQVRVISQFIDLRPKTGFSYEHWFVLHLIRKQVQSQKLPIAPQMVQNLMILAAKDQHWNEVAEWKVIAKEQGIGLYDLTENQLKEIHRQQVEKKLVAASYEESTEVSKTRAIDWFKNQITQAVQNDPYSLEQLNAYLKEIYADQSRKIAWERLLKTMGLEVSKEIRSIDSPMYHLLQRGFYVHLRSKLLQGLDLNHFLYAMRENVAEKYEGQIRDRKNYDKKIAVTFKKEVFGLGKKGFDFTGKVTDFFANLWSEVRYKVKMKGAGELVRQVFRDAGKDFWPNVLKPFEQNERRENRKKTVSRAMPWNWGRTKPKTFVEPAELNVATVQDSKILDVISILQRMQKWNAEKYEHAESVIAERGDAEKELTPRIMGDLFVELSQEKIELLLQKYVIDDFFVLKTFDLKKSIEKLNLDINGPPVEGSIDSKPVTRRMEVIATHINRSYEKFKYIMNRDGTRGYAGSDGTLNTLIFPFPSIKTIKKVYKAVVTFVELNLGINVGMLSSVIDVLPVAGSETKNALIAEISAKMDGKETVTRKLLKELIEVKGFRASDMTGLAFEALEHDKSDVFKFIAGLEESKFNPNQTRIYDGEAITLVERAIQLELHDQFRILMGLNHLDPKTKTKFAALVKEKNFNKYVSNPTDSNLSEITIDYNEALKAKETVVVEKPAPAPVEIKEPVAEVKVVVAKDPNEPSEVFKRAIVEQVMSGTINGDEGVRKLLQDKRAAPALINETLIEVASKIESKRTRVNRPFFSIESLATLVQHPNADVELGLKAIAIAFERSNKDYHGPLDQAEDVLEIRLKQEQVAKTIATPASNESKGRIAKWWSQTKNYFARKNIQPSESVSKVIAENVSVPAEIAPAEIAILNEYELVPESIAPEKLVVELVQEAEVKKVVETSVELPAAEEVKTETVAKTPKLKVQAKPAVVQNDSNLQAEIERKNLLHTIATKIRGEKKPVISKLLKSNLIRAQDIESLTELALENNKPHYFNELFQHSLFEPTDKILFLTIQLGQYKPFKAVMKHKRVNQKRYARFKCLLDEERNFDRYSKNLKQETLVAIQKEYQENLSQQKIERGEIVLVEPIIKVEAPVRGEAELESTDKSGGGYLYTFIIPPPRELAKIWRAFIGLFRSTQSAPENVVVTAPEVAPDTRVHIETLDLYERFIAWNKIILDRTKANYRDGEAYEKTLLALFPELSAEQKTVLRNNYIRQNISFYRDESGWPTAEKFIHEFNVALPVVEDSEERSRVKEAIEHMNSVHERYVEYVVSGPKELQVAARPIGVSKPEGVKAEVVSIEKPVGVVAQPVIEQVEAPATIPEVKPIERSVYKNHPDLIKKHRESLRGATMNKILHDELHVKSENLTAEEISFIRNYIDANIIFSASTGGNTFLHTACEKGYHPKIIQMLADHGFSMNVVNSKGYSPTALWITNYIKTVEAHPERVDVIDQVIRNLNNKHKIRMDAQHIPGGRMLPDYITEKVPVRAHRKHILADLKIPDFKYTNDIIDMIHRNIVLGEFPNYEKVLEHVEKGIDIFDYYYDRHGYEQHLSQLFKLLAIFEKQEEFLGKEKAEKTKDLLGKIILTAFDKQAKPDAGLLRADELRLITRLGVGFHADAYVHKGPYVFKHDYALRSEIFYRYVIINPEILATNTWVLDQFVYIARELETAKFENCLDQIFKLSFEKQQTIYNYFSNAEESGKNTYNRTLVNQAVFAEVDISYLRKMRQNGADFTIQNDHYMGHDEEGKPRESVGVHHHLDVIIRYAFHFKNRENAKKVFKFLLDEVGLLPRHKLKNDFVEEFAVAMREYGFTAEETKEIATSIHQKQFKQEESSEKLLATMQRELDHSYKHGVFRDRVVKETEFAQLVKAAIAKSEAKNGGSLAKEHEQEKIREFLEENTTNESKKNVWSEIEKALNIKQLHAGNKGSKERANQFESRSAHAHFTGNPKPGVTYPHKITFEKIQELKKYKEWVLENFPKEITAYNEKMGNPNAFNELLSLSMSKEVMIFGGASDTQVAAKDPTVRNFTKYKGHLEGAATGQQILEDGTLISNPKPLRKAQVPFFQKILDHFIAGNRDGFIVSPKGTGKTVLFSKLIEAFKPTEARPVYILEESVGMVHQTYARLKQFTNISNDAVGRVGDYISEIGKPVTVMTYASFVKLTKEGVIKPNADALVIYDEAHRSLSELRGKIAKMWSVARRFGVTASDKFSELKQVANILHHEIWRLPVPDAIDAEMMAPQKVIGIRFDKVDVAGADRGKKGFDDKKLSKILQQNRVTAPIIEAYKEYLPLTNAPLAVVNCVDIQDAETTANDFRKAGIEAIAVHGGNAEFARTPEQQKVIRDFSENRSPYKVLMLVKLGEGLDFQDVGLVLNKAITYSDVNNVQRVPNTRISERYPNKLGIVLEFIYANSRRQQNGQPLQKLYSEVIQGDERFPQKTSPYSKFRSRFEAIAKRLSTYSGKDIVVVSKEELISVGAKKTNWQLEFDRSPAEAANLFKQRVSLINQSGVSASITSSMDYPKSPRLLDLPSNRMADKILIQGGRDWVWLTNPEIDYARINWLAELRKSPVKAAKLLQGAIAQFNEGKAESGKIKGYATYPKSVRLLVLPNEMMAARILKAANKTWSYACQSTETKGYWREQLERNPSKAYELLKKAWTTHVAENKDAKQTSKYYDKVKDDKLPATYVAREIMDAAGKNWDNLFDREVKFEKINWTELSEKTPQKAARLLRQKLLALNDGRENKITNTGNYPEVTKDLDIPSLKTAKKVLDAAGKDMAWAVKKPKLSPVMPMGPAMLLNPDGIEWLSYHAYEFGQRLQSKMDALTDHLQVFVERFPARLASIKEWILLAVDGRYVSSDKAALLKERRDAGLMDEPGIEPENDPSPEDKKKMEKLIQEAKAILKDGEYVVKHHGKYWTLNQIREGIHKHNSKRSSKNKQINGPKSMDVWASKANVPDRDKVAALLILNNKNQDWFYKTEFTYDLDSEVAKYKKENPQRKLLVEKGRLWTANEMMRIKDAYNNNPETPENEKITNIKTWSEHYSKANLPEESMVKTVTENDGYSKEWMFGEVEKEYHLETEVNKFKKQYPGFEPIIARGRVWTAELFEARKAKYNETAPEGKKIIGKRTHDKNYSKAGLPDRKISYLIMEQDLAIKGLPSSKPVKPMFLTLDQQIEKYKLLNDGRLPVVFEEKVWTAFEILYLKDEYNKNVSEKLRITDWETWIRYFREAKLPDIAIAEKVLITDLKTEFYLFGTISNFADLQAAVEKHNEIFKSEPEKQLRKFDKTWDQNRKFSKLNIPEIKIARGFIRGDGKTIAQLFKRGPSGISGAFFEEKPVDLATVQEIAKVQILTGPENVGEVKRNGTGPNVYSSIIPGLPQFINWVQKKVSGESSQKPQQEPTNEDMNSTKDLDKYLTDLQIKMATMIEKDNGKLKLSSLKDTKAFETLVQYFQSQRWNMTEVDRDTLRKFVAKQQRQAARGNKLSQSLMSIKLVSELMEVLYKDTTGASFKAEFEEMKNREAATPRWFEEHIVDKLGKYQNEGRAVMRVSVTAGRESGKFMFALLMNTVIEEFTNPTVGLKEFIHLVNDTPHHLLGLATFSLGAGGGSTLSKLIADRVYGASIEGIQYQVQRSLIRGSQAKLTASMTVGLRTYVRGQIGFIVGSIVNGYLYDDHNDPMFWDRQVKSIGSFMIASAMVKGSIYSSVKIVEAFRLVRSGTAAASVNPAGLIWQGLILTAEIYVAPIVQAFYEKSEMQAKLEPMMAQPFHEYIAVLTGKTYGTGCNQAEKPQVLVCLQNKILLGVQQNWQMLTQYELNRKYQEHLAEFSEWEKDDVASKMVASTDNIYQAVKSSMDMVYSPSMTASKALYQTDQKIIALSPWRDISKLGERFRVVLPVANTQMMQEGTQEYFEELEELNTDYVNDMVSMFKEFNEDMTEDERVRKRYDELTKAKEQETKDINICNAGLEEEKQACKQEAEKKYYENLVSIVNGGSSELTSTQERVWNAKRSSNPFAMMKFFGAKTYGLEKIPSITFGGRASASEMLDLIIQMSQKISALKPTEEPVIQAQKETVELLLMMYQELTVDVWQHIYFTDQTNPYVGQDKIKEVEMVSSYMPYGYDHASKTLNRKSFTPWMTSTQQKYVMVLPEKKPEKVDDYAFARVIVDQLLQKGIIQIPLARGDERMQKLYEAMQTYFLLALGYKPDDYSSLFYLAENINIADLKKMDRVVEAYKKMGTTSLLSNYECEAVRDQNALSVEERNKRCINSKSISIQIMQQPSVASDAQMASMDSKTKNAHYWRSKFRSPTKLSLTVPYGQMFIHDSTLNTLLSVH